MFYAVKFLIQAQPFTDIGDIIIGNQELQISFDLAVFHISDFFFLFENIPELIFFQFLYGFIEDPVVHFKADLRNKTALLCAQKVSCTPDIQVAHGNIEATAKVSKFLNGF